MTFDQQVFITLLDKGLLALVLLVGGFFLNWFLQHWKARDETIQELAQDRATTYQRLWSILVDVSPSSHEDIPANVREKLDQDLIKWYHKESGALFLSWKATKQFLLTLDMLRDTQSSSSDVRSAFSRIRTRLKQDCGIYDFFDARRQLPTPRPFPEPGSNH